ncbi:MAG: chromosomal replication initiator protein DnaA [Phycisphaerae bacterium]|nr:chromosomal replication initiator protein DnaA [Phycisphaerae bacterium]NUQ46353.1 chromosomal replication initiator protein DnaA [Phycisphaerae bacterium]
MSRLSNEAWSELLAYVRQHYSELNGCGIENSPGATLSGGVLCVFAEDEAAAAQLVRHARRALADAAQSVWGHLVAIEFRAGLPPAESEAAPHSGNGQVVAEDGGRGGRLCDDRPALRLNPEYRFELFITGPENRLAHASALAVAESPGAAYNPLFIHGPSGLGKTHLLQAICHQVLEARPGARITYLQCESFVNEFIEAVEQGRMHEFRHRYRESDLLLVDDVQFLKKGESSQDEFFHTFNALYQFQRQIVLSADCAPGEIPDLAERLVSRFKWGLVARLDPLCRETRIAILRTKARRRGLTIADDVLDAIGETVKGNARELEGALMQVWAEARVQGAAPSPELALRILGARGPEGDGRRSPTLEEIAGEVASQFGFRISDIRGRRRHRQVATARQSCMYLARKLTAHSLEEIGEFLGRRDHSTVIHAERAIAKRREADARLRAVLDRIEAKLAGKVEG